VDCPLWELIRDANVESFSKGCQSIKRITKLVWFWHEDFFYLSPWIQQSLFVWWWISPSLISTSRIYLNNAFIKMVFGFYNVLSLFFLNYVFSHQPGISLVYWVYCHYCGSFLIWNINEVSYKYFFKLLYIIYINIDVSQVCHCGPCYTTPHEPLHLQIKINDNIIMIIIGSSK